MTVLTTLLSDLDCYLASERVRLTGLIANDCVKGKHVPGSLHARRLKETEDLIYRVRDELAEHDSQREVV